jgi:hypothetical protein
MGGVGAYSFPSQPHGRNQRKSCRSPITAAVRPGLERAAEQQCTLHVRRRRRPGTIEAGNTAHDLLVFPAQKDVCPTRYPS